MFKKILYSFKIFKQNYVGLVNFFFSSVGHLNICVTRKFFLIKTQKQGFQT